MKKKQHEDTPIARILGEVEHVFVRKHEDYGPKNISESPFGPMRGVLTRMYDKQARAVNLIDKDSHNFESLEDTFIDMIGYSIVALMVLRGEWPGVKKGDM